MTELSEGLDLSAIDSISPEEVQQNLAHIWSWRGPLYETYAMSLYIDYAPDFGKLSRWSGDVFGRRSGSRNVILASAQNIHSYMMMGWETGLRNEFYVLWRNGMSKEDVLELVMFSQMYAGMRGLGHVYHAVGDLLPIWAPPKEPAVYPEGWAADPEAFKCGLDLSTRELTDSDVANLTEWYERTIGYVPKSIKFGIKRNPKFVKLNRARWEVTLKTTPKQLAPYLMLRHHTITGSIEGLRESALLGKAWGITPDLIVRAVTNTAMYFTHFEGLYAVEEALEDILENWDK
ncbi:hypothetical protein GCM10022251_22300 [Phytohabitans flavus]|uniref:Uncharacterized protein n=1 Tax=Phytohabitans flavus TaxID=1076124 RepID=A0A6F8XRW8_9ACTN|nr:hypothetical protein [Phytohabitans flavus]BCB76592.1 hypothetical protein Pflav_030020 [Phytohabitans flavus]